MADAQLTQQLKSWIVTCKVPVFRIDFAELTTYPEEVIANLIEFLGIEPADEEIASANRFTKQLIGNKRTALPKLIPDDEIVEATENRTVSSYTVNPGRFDWSSFFVHLIEVVGLIRGAFTKHFTMFPTG